MSDQPQGPGRSFWRSSPATPRRSTRWTAIAEVGRAARLQGRADPDAGTARLFDLEQAAAESKTYCDEITGIAARARPRDHRARRPTCRASSSPCIRPTTKRFDGFAPAAVRGNPKARQQWAVEQMQLRRQGLPQPRPRTAMSASPARSPGRSSTRGRSARPGLIETAFDELARRWRPILDAFDDAGCRRRFELHPGEDLLRRRHLRDVPRPRRRATRAAASTTTRRTSCCSSSTTSSSSTSTTSASRRFHVKDAEFNPTGRQGVYCGFQPWIEPRRPLPLARRRPGRFRARSSRSWRSTATTAGPCSNGSAASSTRSRAPREGAPFISATSSA